MEIFDIVDEHGVPTGATVERVTAHAEGIRHRTAHVWVVRSAPEGPQVLLQKRADQKDSFPGCYDTSSAGHIPAGQEPLASALRELEEELGIRAMKEDLTFIGCFTIQYEKVFYGKPFRDHEISFVYAYTKPVDTASLRLQAEEVSAVRWFGVQELAALLSPRDPRICVPEGGFELIRAWCEAQGLLTF